MNIFAHFEVLKLKYEHLLYKFLIIKNCFRKNIFNLFRREYQLILLLKLHSIFIFSSMTKNEMLFNSICDYFNH